MAKYRKKPVVIDAEVYKPGLEDGIHYYIDTYDNGVPENEVAEIRECGQTVSEIPYIETLEGRHFISKFDFIITGVKGERYPCKPDIFEMTYEKVEEVNETIRESK